MTAEALVPALVQRLPAKKRAVWAVMARHLQGTSHPTFYANISQIAREAGCSARTVVLFFKILRSAGLLEYRYPRNNRKTGPALHLNWSFVTASDPSPISPPPGVRPSLRDGLHPSGNWRKTAVGAFRRLFRDRLFLAEEQTETLLRLIGRWVWKLKWPRAMLLHLYEKIRTSPGRFQPPLEGLSGRALCCWFISRVRALLRAVRSLLEGERVVNLVERWRAQVLADPLGGGSGPGAGAVELEPGQDGAGLPGAASASGRVGQGPEDQIPSSLPAPRPVRSTHVSAEAIERARRLIAAHPEWRGEAPSLRCGRAVGGDGDRAHALQPPGS